MDKKSEKTYRFPKGFLWGSATSAHQVEGNNIHSDWWHEENYKKKSQEYPFEPSSIACDSYNRYEEDFDLAKKMNNNSIRISIEWARIEPKENHFDQNEIDHYKKVIKAAKKRGFKVMVTLHHFTNPLWFYQKGAFLNIKAPYYFSRYAKRCAKEFGSSIDYYVTINEPQVYAMQSYLKGFWPPFNINPIYFFLAQIGLIISHIKAYRAIKCVDRNLSVGIVKNIVHYETDSHLLDRLAAKVLYFLGCNAFLKPLYFASTLDFIGMNYYFTGIIKQFKQKNPNDVVSDLGWWINPPGLEKALMHLKHHYKGMPNYVTENGLADSKDEKRIHFINTMLVHTAKALENGANVKGYFHWSLIDNFEWHHGFWPRFGLIEIDREDNLKRIPRKSYKYYSQICKSNGVVPL